MGEIFNAVLLIPIGIVGILSGIFEGIFKCALSYFKAFSYSFSSKYSARSKSEAKEPSKEKYFFYRQYEDLWNTYKSAAAINKGNILIIRQKLSVGSYFAVCRLKTAGIVISWLGKLINTICFSIHFIIVTVMSIPVFTLYYIVTFIEEAKLKKGKISGVCPYCGSTYKIPFYICPKCGQVHKKLVPGCYGIIRRKCSCGEVIPSTHLGGRYKLGAICPVCSKSIRIKEASPVCISIAGWKEEERMNLLYSAKDILINDVSRKKNWNTELLEDESTDTCNVLIDCSKFSSKKLLYLYNGSVECDNFRTDMRKMKYYRYIHGLIFIIDYSDMDNIFQDDYIDQFIIGLRQIRDTKPNEPIDIPAAVILNEADNLKYNEDKKKNIMRKIQYNFANYEFFSGKIEALEWILYKANNELR